MRNLICTFFFFASLISFSAQPADQYKKEIARFDKELSEMITENEPGASIIITKGIKIIFEKYYGLANLESGEKLCAGHVLGIASMSKQFTGMAILFLEHEGLVDLNDEITKYFPDLPISDRKITIKQLLSHTSGLPELTRNDEFMNSINTAHTINEIIDLGFKGEFRSRPGEKFVYNNTGYTIAVALIEKLSGMKYSDYLNKKIFLPLGSTIHIPVILKMTQ